MSQFDPSFGAVALEALGWTWPELAGAAGVQALLIRKARSWARPSFTWLVLSLTVAAACFAALWLDVAVFKYEPPTDVPPLSQAVERELLLWRLGLIQPLLVVCAASELLLVFGPRFWSRRSRTVLSVASGIVASWAAAIWLLVSPHYEAVLHAFFQPGVLGLTASVIGFSMTTAVWVVRWRVEPNCFR